MSPRDSPSGRPTVAEGATVREGAAAFALAPGRSWAATSSSTSSARAGWPRSTSPTTRSSRAGSPSKSCAQTRAIRTRTPACSVKRRPWPVCRTPTSWPSTTWARSAAACSSPRSTWRGRRSRRGWRNRAPGARSSPCSRRRGAGSRPRTRAASCIATSSPTTCSSVTTDASWSATSASPGGGRASGVRLLPALAAGADPRVRPERARTRQHERRVHQLADYPDRHDAGHRRLHVAGACVRPGRRSAQRSVQLQRDAVPRALRAAPVRLHRPHLLPRSAREPSAPASAQARVPRWIHESSCAGWRSSRRTLPSMTELLAALDRDPTRRRRGDGRSLPGSHSWGSRPWVGASPAESPRGVPRRRGPDRGDLGTRHA